LDSSGCIISHRSFTTESEVEAVVEVISQWELDPVTSIRYRLQPNGDGYCIDLVNQGKAVRCSMAKDGRLEVDG